MPCRATRMSTASTACLTINLEATCARLTTAQLVMDFVTPSMSVAPMAKHIRASACCGETPVSIRSTWQWNTLRIAMVSHQTKQSFLSQISGHLKYLHLLFQRQEKWCFGLWLILNGKETTCLSEWCSRGAASRCVDTFMRTSIHIYCQSSSVRPIFFIQWESFLRH